MCWFEVFLRFICGDVKVLECRGEVGGREESGYLVWR